MSVKVYLDDYDVKFDTYKNKDYIELDIDILEDFDEDDLVDELEFREFNFFEKDANLVLCTDYLEEKGFSVVKEDEKHIIGLDVIDARLLQEIINKFHSLNFDGRQKMAEKVNKL